MGLRVAMVLNDLNLSGGVIVALQHARGLRLSGHDVTVGVIHDEHAEVLSDWSSQIRIRSLNELADENEPFDVVVTTWWETNYVAHRIRAKSYIWFCQSMEDRFYPQSLQHVTEFRAVVECCLPVITEATWIRDQFKKWMPTLDIELARNGLDHSIFNSAGRTQNDGPVRVLIGGNSSSPFKGVSDALEAVDLCRERIEVTHITGERPTGESKVLRIGPLTLDEMSDQYRQHDVLVKTSRVEGMFGPPLEMFACGGTAIVLPVTGYDEYIVDEHNALVGRWDDPYSVARLVDRLAVDKEKLLQLQSLAEETARNWPSWEEASAEFERRLLMLYRRDQADAGRSALATTALKSLSRLATVTRGSPSAKRTGVVPNGTNTSRLPTKFQRWS